MASPRTKLAVGNCLLFCIQAPGQLLPTQFSARLSTGTYQPQPCRTSDAFEFGGVRSAAGRLFFLVRVKQSHGQVSRLLALRFVAAQQACRSEVPRGSPACMPGSLLAACVPLPAAAVWRHGRCCISNVAALWGVPWQNCIAALCCPCDLGWPVFPRACAIPAAGGLGFRSVRAGSGCRTAPGASFCCVKQTRLGMHAVTHSCASVACLVAAAVNSADTFALCALRMCLRPCPARVLLAVRVRSLAACPPFSHDSCVC